MGNRQFYDQMLRDAIFQQQYKITDEVDVTTLKDYMQVYTHITYPDLIYPEYSLFQTHVWGPIHFITKNFFTYPEI